MTKQSQFHRLIVRDKGVFNGKNFSISTDSMSWIPAYAIFITNEGQLYSSDDNDNNYLLLQYLQSCYIQIIPNIQNNQSLRSKRTKTKKSDQNNDNMPPVIYIKTFDNERLYIKVQSKNNFGNLISSLIVWQNLKPKSLVKKWYCENKFINSNPDFVHEVLVCRFKVYGPIINKGKNINIVNGPKVPKFRNLNNTLVGGITNDSLPTTSSINEGWFYTMGALNSNGILNLITEMDGTLLYSIDIKEILSSEIREVHHSIFDNSNVLYIGQLGELRWNNLIKSISSTSYDQNYSPFLVKDNKPINSHQRILVEFPLHIDLEDWFVGLNYFSKREYIGSFDPKTSSINKSSSINDIVNKLEDLTLVDHDDSFNIDQTINSIPLKGESMVKTSTNSLNNPGLKIYEKESFRVSKKLLIDIIEAKFDQLSKISNSSSKIYAEVLMWKVPWSRTAIVNFTSNPFWKEEFSTDLPISTQIIHILIKQCISDGYLDNDHIIGTVFITPDILSRNLGNSSTIMIEGNETVNTPTDNSPGNDIVKLPIYDYSNVPIGKLLVNVKLKEYHILSPKNFKPLESMLYNAPMKDLIEFCNQNVSTSDFENVSLIMLDIFQSLGIEDKWFKELMDYELVNVDKVTRQNYSSSTPNPTKTSSSNNVFNTLFRGSSIFSKSLEKYNLRIGQEYLEKVFGNFFAIISKEKKNCEVDPRYVKLHAKAELRGKIIDDNNLDVEGSDSEDEYDSDEEIELDKKVKSMVEENYQNLYNYAEEIWHKIYITSNDLPEQIKSQLKNFRTKVELACDPNDKTTALNCLSAFIFLRFFCPAILNPKLFYLTKNHQTGKSQRTLTLIAKILLNLANRQEFSPHKEPHLVRMNEFLFKYQHEVLDYFDKITGRKNDFNEKILDLSHEVKRFDLGLSGDSTSNELPTTPYLIDKYLRLTELIYLLDKKEVDELSEDDYYQENEENDEELVDEVPDEELEETELDDEVANTVLNNKTLLNGINDEGYDNFDEDLSTKIQKKLKSSIKEGDIKIKNNVYQIGSLEFEKSEFLDLAGDDDTEDFIKSLCKSDENIFSFITSNITLKDLQKRSNNLKKKIVETENFLKNYEYPNNYQGDQHMWNSFTHEILDNTYLDLERNCLVQLDDYDGEIPHHYKKVVDNGLNYLKLKFVDESNTTTVKSTTSLNKIKESTSQETFNTVSKSSSTKNPFKKWFKG